jgi:hypothetical protein
MQRLQKSAQMVLAECFGHFRVTREELHEVISLPVTNIAKHDTKPRHRFREALRAN